MGLSLTRTSVGRRVRRRLGACARRAHAHCTKDSGKPPQRCAHGLDALVYLGKLFLTLLAASKTLPVMPRSRL